MGFLSQWLTNPPEIKSEVQKVKVVHSELSDLVWRISLQKYYLSQQLPQHLSDDFYLFQGNIGVFKSKKEAENEFLKVNHINLEEVIDTAKVNQLRPQTFEAYVGQDETKEVLKKTIKACRILKQSIPHSLFAGQFGIGKTTLAKIMANEIDAPFISATASALDSKDSLLKIFTHPKLQTKIPAIVFIDELHNLKSELAEQLYTALEDFSFDYTDEEGLTKTFAVPPFTCVGATTQKGKIDLAMLSRFECFDLNPYNVPELNVMSKTLLDRLNVKDYELKGLDLIAKVSRSTARTCTLLTLGAYRTAIADNKPLTETIVREMLTMKGIDDCGLTKLDRAYLSFLGSVKQAGIGTICKKLLSMGGDKKTVENITEPFLLSLGHIEFTPQGRMITNEGKIYTQKGDMK